MPKALPEALLRWLKLNHIQDVVGHIESQAFDEVTLVGWSYGGMVIAGVLPRKTQRVKAMVYVDAFVPDNNMALIDYVLAPEIKTYFEEFKNSRQAIAPLPFESFGMRDSYWISYLAPRVCRFRPLRPVGMPIMVDGASS